MPARHHTDRRLAVGADRGADRDLLHRAVVPAHEDLLKGTVLAEAGQELPAAVGLVLDPLLDGSAAVVDVRPDCWAKAAHAGPQTTAMATLSSEMRPNLLAFT
jgi:hypothetical protein